MQSSIPQKRLHVQFNGYLPEIESYFEHIGKINLDDLVNEKGECRGVLGAPQY